MWLPWDYSLLLAGGFLVVRWSVLRWRPVQSDAIAAFLREATIVAALYTCWQVAGRLSVIQIDDAVTRGIAVWDLERALYLPSEATAQQHLLPHGLAVQASNIYYAGFHVPGMGIFLLWMFVRHREYYPRWRNALAGLTAVCLLIQLVPVAPPRLIPELGLVDTGILYGQSVYATMGSTSAGQLQAMPSLHVGWAALVAVAAAVTSTSRWRWIGFGHAVLTFYVVAVTGNHYWLDGIVAIVLLAPIAVLTHQVAERRITRQMSQFLPDSAD